MEWQSTEKQDLDFSSIDLQSELENEIPITEITDMPPPPPPMVQQVIEIVADDLEIEEVDEEGVVNIPFSVIEDVPIYPSCENIKGKLQKRKCLSDQVMKFVQKNFDTELAAELGLEDRQRISVEFKIDKKAASMGELLFLAYNNQTKTIRTVK